MITISVLNSKGGVGKTTTTLALATLLAKQGLQTLIIDMAPQANATLTLYDGNAVPNICNYLTEEITEEKIGEYIKPIREDDLFEEIKESLYILPGSQKLNNMKTVLNPDGTSLKKAMEPLEDYFDVVLIDNDPLLDILARTSLIASDAVICPIKMDLYSFQGSKDLIRYIRDIKDRENENLLIKGFLPTMFRTTGSDKNVLEEFRKYYNGDFIMQTVIRERTSVTNSNRVRLPLPIYDKEDECTLDYMKALDELDILESPEREKLRSEIQRIDTKIEDRKARRRKKTKEKK